MVLTFDRPIGAHGDVAELEYVSALMQTEDELRPNACLSLTDILLYLKSRHGFVVEESVVQEQLLQELGGQTNDSSEGYLDLCQLVSTLLIPYLAQACYDGNQEPFDFLLRSLTGDDDTDTAVTEKNLCVLFDTFGDFHVDTALIQEMLTVAGFSHDRQAAGSMVQALVGDVLDYNCDWKTSMTLNYHDALHVRETHNFSENDVDEELPPHLPIVRNKQENVNKRKPPSNPLARIYTAACVDYTADTFRRPIFVMVLWTCAVSLYFAYMWGYRTGEDNWTHIDCGDNVGCDIADGITRWLGIGIQLSTMGVVFIFCASLGSSVYIQKKFITLSCLFAGFCVIFLFAVVPFFVPMDTRFFSTLGNKAQYDDVDETSDIFNASYYVSLVLGFCLLLTQCVDFVFVVVPKGWLKTKRCLQSMITPSTVKSEAFQKQAAEYKVNKMVANAMKFQPQAVGKGKQTSTSLHVAPSERGSTQAALNYYLQVTGVEQVGGVIWAWRRVFNNTMRTEEGVWLHGRLYSCNFAQVVAGCFFIYFSYLGYSHIDTFTAQSISDLIEEEGFDLLNETIYSDDAFTVAVEKLQFTRGSYIAAITVGMVAGLAVIVYATIVFIPSHVSTVLRYRCGDFRSLHDRWFLRYRKNIESATALFGSAFWGALLGSVYTALFFGCIVLAIHLCQERAGSVILAWAVGFVVLCLIKKIVLHFLRALLHRAFYRNKPAATNMTDIIFASWNIALSVGFILSRFIKILVVAAFHVGRLDTPLFAPGVDKLFCFELDGYPRIFQTDALMHDAHRHPYIEHFGLLCLLKLRLGNEFARRPHSCWRLLYTLCLMPWLRKYRLGVLSDGQVEDRIEELEEQLENVDATENSENEIIHQMKRLRNSRAIENREAALEGKAKHLKAKNHNLKKKNRDLAKKLEAALRDKRRLKLQLQQRGASSADLERRNSE